MLVDRVARKASLNLENKLIKAPAGSGKTSLLTNYYLKLLGLVEHPRQIQAMTFTNKAAKEMADRVIESIARVKSGFVPTSDYEKDNFELAKAALENSQSRGWNIESNVNMLQVSTIDSFCKRLLISNVGEQEGLLATGNISNDPYSIYLKAVKDTLELYSDNTYGEPIQKLMSHFGHKFSRVEKLLIEMLQTRERWIPILFDSKESTKEALEHQRAKFIETSLSASYGKLLSFEPQIQNVISQLDVDCPDLKQIVNHGFSSLLQSGNQVRAVSKILLTKGKKPKKRFTKSDGVPPAMDKSDKAALIEQLQSAAHECSQYLTQLSSMPEAEFKDSEWVLLEAVFNVMPILLANLSMTFKEVGEVDFTEVSLSALQALNGDSGKATSNAINKSHAIKHILVDEFQDSNDTQLIMLELLMSSWAPGDGNTLFLVGDAMQSLYGFRGANVNVFMEAENGIGHIPLISYELSTNFRSTSGVVDWVNSVFSNAFPSENDLLLGASCYKPSSAIKVANNEMKPVELHGFLDDCDASQEAEFIVEKIKEIKAKEPEATIGVLGRTRSALSAVITKLNYASDVETLAVDINRIDKEPICIPAIALARVIIDDLDKLAWLTLLNSGLVGLTHLQIESIFALDEDPFLAVNNEKALSCLDDGCRDRYVYVIEHVNQALNDKRSKDLDVLLKGLWMQLHGPSLATKKLDMENIDTFFSIFEEVSGTEISLCWLERKLESLYARSKTSSSSAGSSSVELMTIHKAKGLEFDFVFIPGMHKQGAQSQSQLISWSTMGGRDNAAVMACSEAIGIKSDDLGYHKFLASMKQKREQQELIRLLYVGTTRAIKKAYLTAKVTLNNESISSPRKGSMLAVINDAIETDMVIHQPDALVPIVERHPVVRTIDADLNLKLPVRNTLAAYRGKSNSQVLKDGINWKRPVSKIEGVVIHQLIEQINIDGIDAWSVQKVDQYSRVILASLKELSLSKEFLIQSVNRVKHEIKSLLSCEQFRELTTRQGSSDAELKLAVRKHRIIQVIRIDKGIQEGDGCGRVVNWSNGSQEEGQSLNKYIGSQKSQLRSKMRLYAAAYAEVKGLAKVNTALYFTADHKLEECG